MRIHFKRLGMTVVSILRDIIAIIDGTNLNFHSTPPVYSWRYQLRTQADASAASTILRGRCTYEDPIYYSSLLGSAGYVFIETSDCLLLYYSRLQS